MTIVKELLKEGAIITAFDPIAIPNAQHVLGNTIEYTQDIRLALLHADVAIIATEWEEIKQLPLDSYELYMKKPIVIDGRNCYSLQRNSKISDDLYFDRKTDCYK